MGSLITSVSPANGGSITAEHYGPSGTTWGEFYRLTATPASGYQFSHWMYKEWGNSNYVRYTNNPLNVTGPPSFEESDTEAIAYFTETTPPQPTTYTVTVAANPVAGGNVTGGGTYNAGATCTITATPNQNYSFAGWTASDGSSPVNTATHTFTVTNDVTWTASFTYSPPPPTTHTVTVVASPAASGNVSGGGTYYRGDSCTITATPVSGKSFIRWEASDGSSPVNTATHTFTVTGNVTWTAIFQDGWLVKVKIVRGASLGSFNHPVTWIDNSNPGRQTLLDVTEIENTPTSYVVIIPPKSFKVALYNNDFFIGVNDPRYELDYVRVIKGYQPGLYIGRDSYGWQGLIVNYGVQYSLAFDGAEVELYFRYKSTGELLYGSSGTLLHGSSGNPLYL